MRIADKVVPNLVGVDIGCGMETVRLDVREIDPKKLDHLIHQRIPSGFCIRETAHRLNGEIDLRELRCRSRVDLARARLSIGTLGGGNHFIEVDRDAEGGLFLVVHSGSRHLGLQAAELYQMEAVRQLKGLRVEGIPRDLAYVSGKLLEDYLHDMKIIQRFALLNRRAMVAEILDGLGLPVLEAFSTIHNYIDTDEMILRKGAVSARKGERILIPINMRDGSLICRGKGNEEWNCSAPHGAGRLMSRTKARAECSLEEFRESMRGIFSTSIRADTLDECPMAYKSMDDIVSNIGPTAEIERRIVPIYSFKAGGE
jgi:RNA-splicing ligase RtcB